MRRVGRSKRRLTDGRQGTGLQEQGQEAEGRQEEVVATDRPSDHALLAHAIEQARIGHDEGGIPIGAALVVDGEVLAVGRNRRVQQGSAIRHGETDALENAGRLPASVYRRATMVTTLSPCDMCTGAILLYDIGRVVIGENRTFLGREDLLRSRGVEVVVLDSAECVDLMTEFIAENPDLWNEDIGEEA
jgi:creatinine deaminase